MTFYHGLGMFSLGMVVFFVGTIAAYLIINKVMEEDENNNNDQFCVFNWVQCEVRQLRSHYVSSTMDNKK